MDFLAKLLGLQQGAPAPRQSGKNFPVPGFYQQAVQDLVGYGGRQGLQRPVMGTGGDPRLQVQSNSQARQYADQMPHNYFGPSVANGDEGNPTLQGYNQDDLSTGLQGGTVNQGAIPLQGSKGAAARPIQGGSPLQFIRQLLGR